MNIPQVWEAEQEASRLPTKYLIPLQFQNCFQNCQDMPSKTTPGPPGTAWRGSNNLNSSPRGQVSNSAITFFPHFIFLCFYAHPKAFQNPDPTVFLKSIYQLHYSCPDIGGEKKNTLCLKIEAQPLMQTLIQTPIQWRTDLNNTAHSNSKLLHRSTQIFFSLLPHD